MRSISVRLITDTVRKLAKEANFVLRPDVYRALNKAFKSEANKKAKGFLKAIIENARIANKEKVAICQDTGLPVVFVEIGQDVHFVGGSLNDAVSKGIDLGYKQGFLRNSVVKDPFLRKGSGFTPPIIHTEIVKGSKVKLTVLPKGFGSENKSKVKMFKPTASLEAIKEFVVGAVEEAGPDACPPYVVGVGVGGTVDYACLLAKKALLRRVKSQESRVKSTVQKSKIEKLQKELLSKINKLNIGPMGLGGKTTALAVNIETYPTHIAGLPVAVNISCHALRSATKII